MAVQRRVWESGGNRPLTESAFINEEDNHNTPLTLTFAAGYWMDV